MLQLEHDILNPRHIAATRTILDLDIRKAFDNVSRAAVLGNVAEINVGSRTYNYIRTFLHARTAELSLDDVKSVRITLGTRGTPQEPC